MENIERNTREAFHYIVDLLEGNNIPYKITGGFAARLYGSTRPLADIDIDVDEVALPLLASLTEKYTIDKLGNYTDAHWNLSLITLCYAGQEIDLGSTSSNIFNQQTQTWEAHHGNLANHTKLSVFDKIVPVETKSALMAYKQKLAREVDIIDIEQLGG